LPAVAAIPLLLLVGFLVAYGMALTSRSWTHSLTVWVTHGLGLPNFLADRIAEGAVALTKLVTHELGRYAIPATEAVVKWLAGLAQYAALVGYWSLAWPKELFTFGYWLIHTYIPRALRGAVHPLSKIVHGTVKVVHTVETRVVHVAKAVPATAKTVVIQTVPRSVREASREIEWLRRHYKALTAAVAGAGAISLPWGGAGRVERETKALGKRLGKLERLAVGLGAVTVLYRALRRIGWKCMPRRKTGRLVCGIEGMDNLLLDVLLAEIGLAAGLFSIRALTRDLQAITPAVVDGLGYIVSEAPSDFHDFDADVLAAARALIPGA
jgi:hypothetical protein